MAKSGASDIPAWLKWVAGLMLSTIGAGAGVAVFTFQTFETVSAAERREQYSEQRRQEDLRRLERIEEKLDLLLSRSPAR